MRSRNICKFVTGVNQDRLEVHKFIFESNMDIITTKQYIDTHRIMLISAGGGRAEIAKNTWDFVTGDLIFVFRGEDVVINPDGECEYMYIDFDGARADNLFARFGINKASRIRAGYDGLIPLWHDSLRRASEINLDLAAEGMLLHTFSRLVKSTDEKSTLINRILEITESCFTHPELTVAYVAEELAYNPKYISHAFKEKMGVSYSEYLRNLRIKYAVSLLEHGIDSVKNIAFLSGFTDPMYFSTVFKKTLGVSPKDYMNRRKEQEI